MQTTRSSTGVNDPVFAIGRYVDQPSSLRGTAHTLTMAAAATGRFLLHFLEMVIAMGVGMAIFGPVKTALVDQGYTHFQFVIAASEELAFIQGTDDIARATVVRLRMNAPHAARALAMVSRVRARDRIPFGLTPRAPVHSAQRRTSMSNTLASISARS
jgi:hypothetical protein